MGIASLIIGIVAIVLAFVPCAGWITALPAAVIGLILGIIEMVQKSKKNEPKGMGTAGLILNILAIIIVIVVTAFILPKVQQSMQEAATEFESAMKEATAEMERAATNEAGVTVEESAPAPEPTE